MVYKRYYSPFEQDTIIEPQKVVEPVHMEQNFKEDQDKKTYKCANVPAKNDSPLSFLANIKLDDIVLIALLILLLFEENDKRDMPLIIGIAALLFIEFTEK